MAVLTPSMSSLALSMMTMVVYALMFFMITTHKVKRYYFWTDRWKE
jgi:hypothetical protein